MLIKKEKYRTLAALCETLGQFFYVGAIASNVSVVAPMSSSYSIVSVILSRMFPKEKLTNKQYLILAMIMVAIAILGGMAKQTSRILAPGTVFIRYLLIGRLEPA